MRFFAWDIMRRTSEMRITKILIQNYRSINEIEVEFPHAYVAVCGKNDSGKTNVLRALRILFGSDSPYPFRDEAISIKRDLPQWVSKIDSKQAKIVIEAHCSVSPDADGGLHRFVVDYLQLQTTESLSLMLRSETSERNADVFKVSVNGVEVDKLKAEEIRNKIQSSRAVLFHDSTEPLPKFLFAEGQRFGIFSDIQATDRDELQKAKERLNSTISKIAKRQQKDISGLLGRLKDRYTVGVTVPKFDPAQLPLGITLGDDTVNVALEHWGSGTQNRTMILMALFRARIVSKEETSASKVTPVIVIEEPESFLHPSGQAEFGSILQDLAEEFGVQVVVATHSPYMLSQRAPESNILLRRRQERKKLRETELVDTKGNGWMEPFSLALGIQNAEFEPWAAALFRHSGAIILVEGETDAEYLELLRDKEHGAAALCFTGQIVPYGGKDTLKQPFILRFIKDRHKCCIILYDLDAESEVLPRLRNAGFEKGISCFAVGTEQHKAIEGLVPDRFQKAVLSEHYDLTQVAINGSPADRRSAKGALKKATFNQFKLSAKPSTEDYRSFYALVRDLNKALQRSAKAETGELSGVGRKQKKPAAALPLRVDAFTAGN